MIRTGIGGWVYPEWRKGAFYPEGLPQKRELEWASRQLGAIEINGTYHSLQKPESFRKWREATPEGFVFAVKGSSYVTNRKVLAATGEGMAKFFGQGLEELGDRLGPILWQLMGTKRFDAEDIAAFFDLLPRDLNGVPLRHAIETGHESFACPEFVELARGAGVAIVWCEQESRTPIADRTANFAYLRCKNLQPEQPTGYAPADVERIAGLCRAWEAGEAIEALPHAGDPAQSGGKGGDVFAFMINGAKHRAPAAAMALAERVNA
ncbi:DUF72 domain-containing protein [Altererythrobacter sp. Root672]|uniref:DUF72 domain-containing protein n=1 Tax=Altererythrobacter sp. Root672 TaxID=1736584 RepID=UPI0006FD58A2|nr:DUF72 domain-containing protein [Altererythrobacter sp. Root672]KRA79374.1 hypothetical protein ASD76_17520 [Altererythrobacter sp. Root672]